MSDVESQLRAKILSKLTVATFLAGFYICCAIGTIDESESF